MFRKRVNSFRYAFHGIWILVKTQANARIHLLASLLVVFSGYYFEVSLSEWCILILCISMVLAAEAFNTAIETLTDIASPDIQPSAGFIKDVAAAAVLITAIGSAIIGVLIFLPKVN